MMMCSIPLGRSSVVPVQIPAACVRTQQHKLVLCSASSSSTANHSSSTSDANYLGLSLQQPIVVHGDPPTFVSAPGRRIVAIGDLHGDLDKARCALQMAGVLNSDDQHSWVGGTTVLVQLGDVLDRGEEEIAILSLLKSLDVQARAVGGAVFQVNGNHETMNVEGDYRYVHPGAFSECTDFLHHLELCSHNWDEAFVGWSSLSRTWPQENHKVPQNQWDPWSLVKRQKGVISRSILLRPGGPMASELARHPVILRVNDWVFCHGGLLPHHVEYGIERINQEVSQWMKGLTDDDDDDENPRAPFIATRGYDSVVWSRLYSGDASNLEDYQIEKIRSILRETLRGVGAKAMVVGHTPQIRGVNCEFDCGVWRVDVGMSRGVLDSRPEVLEIKDGRAKAIRNIRDIRYRSNELQVVDYT